MVMLVGYGESALLVWSNVCLLSMQTPYVHGCTALADSKRLVIVVGVGMVLSWWLHLYGFYAASALLF